MSSSDSSSEAESPELELSPSDVRTILTTILDNIDCPVCYQQLQPPIYQCNNGHPICSRCRPRLRSCPVCKSWMYHVRALPLERIVRELPRPCRNASRGCPVRLGANARFRHERSCELRPTLCGEALMPCAWMGPLPQMRKHLNQQHELEGRVHVGLQGRFHFSVSCLTQEKFMEDIEENLLFRCLIRSERGRLYFLCHALAGSVCASSYIFRVLVSHSCSDRRLSFEGQVVSIFQSIGKTTEMSQGLCVAKDWLQGACTCRQRRNCFDATWQLCQKADVRRIEMLRGQVLRMGLDPVQAMDDRLAMVVRSTRQGTRLCLAAEDGTEAAAVASAQGALETIQAASQTMQVAPLTTEAGPETDEMAQAMAEADSSQWRQCQ